MTNSSRFRRNALRLSVAAVGAIALTGCIKMDMDLTLDGDMASGSVIVAVDKGVLDMAGAEPEEVLGDLRESADLPEDATVEPYEDDDYVGQRLEFEDKPLSEFADEDMSISYDPEAGRYEVTGAMDMTDPADTGGVPDAMTETMIESFDIVISITFPGEVIEHNGELSGTTVTWRPAFGEVNEMRAVASDGSSGLPTWLVIGLAGLAAVTAAGLVAFFAVRSRRPAPAPPTAPVEGDQGDTMRA